MFFCYVPKSQASLIWLLLAAAAAEESSKKQTPNPTDFQVQINKINETLPYLCDKAHKYSDCWKPYSVEKREYFVSNTHREDLLTYYKNSGYSVELINDKLVFDFSKYKENYEVYNSALISFETAVVLSFLSLFPLGFIFLLRGSYKRTQEIKKAYMESKDDLFFWKDEDQDLLEAELLKNSRPMNWKFNMKDEKIVGISYYDGNSVGSIAVKKSNLVNSVGSLRSMIPNRRK